MNNKQKKIAEADASMKRAQQLYREAATMPDETDTVEELRSKAQDCADKTFKMNG